MQSFIATVLAFCLSLPSLALGADLTPPSPNALVGYSPRSSQTEREWETKLRAIPDRMPRMDAQPKPGKLFGSGGADHGFDSVVTAVGTLGPDSQLHPRQCQIVVDEQQVLRP